MDKLHSQWIPQSIDKVLRKGYTNFNHHYYIRRKRWMYTCASCNVLSCWTNDREKMPKNCPMHKQELMDEAKQRYEAFSEFFVTSSEIEILGYGRWTRMKEILELCRRMGYKKIGIAFCAGMRDETRVITRIMREHGLEVVSVICKTGGVPKEEMGIREECKAKPYEFESICNPIAQAQLLNEQETEFNVAVGLCVGHDSLFCKHSNALVTTLIAKDRALAHNPIGAIYCADGYFKARLTPGAP